MRKIEFLNGLVITILIIFVFHFATSIYLDFMNFPDGFYKDFIFGYYAKILILVFSLITFVGLLFIQRGLAITLKEGYFNKKSYFKLKTAGQLFLISGGLSLTFDLIHVFNSVSMPLFGTLVQDFLLIIVGFSLYIIADIIQNGNGLKQENDLTI